MDSGYFVLYMVQVMLLPEYEYTDVSLSYDSVPSHFYIILCAVSHILASRPCNAYLP